ERHFLGLAQHFFSGIVGDEHLEIDGAGPRALLLVEFEPVTRDAERYLGEHLAVAVAEGGAVEEEIKIAAADVAPGARVRDTQRHREHDAEEKIGAPRGAYRVKSAGSSHRLVREAERDAVHVAQESQVRPRIVEREIRGLARIDLQAHARTKAFTVCV